MNTRLFVRKRVPYNQVEIELRDELNNEFKLNLGEVKRYNIYDIYNIDQDTYQQAKNSIFSEVMIDDVYESLSLNENCYFAYETLPAQYDQRADSATQCIKLLNQQAQVTIRTGEVVVFDRKLTTAELSQVESYLVNPIECQVKDMSILDFKLDVTVKPLKDLSGFIQFSDDQLLALKRDLSLAMNIDDLRFVQQYFIEQKRDPSETEIYVLDCYWSDHCRHTTFETILDDITIDSALFQTEIQHSFNRYLELKRELNDQKPMTLMNMASIMGKYHRNVLKDTKIEVSEEINACSFETEIINQGQVEKWLIQFKNETHNHPTEIEPYGGASTCIGGAIRDPLSGRSYVYQAMRVSGCGNVLQKREDTLKNKLPQSVISKKATHGNSSYGNQIGLATTHVRELYDDSYVAKHMEVGAVVGASKIGNFKRETPVKGDIVVVIGGRTGRDGIQGASGSSVSHSDTSLSSMSSQVQKGNAIEERKLQRLFRKPEVTKLIKKCNDFGAGGVCVAIGELSDGIEIHLDKVLLKYQGLNPTEIATSESQERMAVVIDPSDYDFFVKECEKENLEYSHVANVTDRRRLEMFYYGEKVVDLTAEFLETSGVRGHQTVLIQDCVRTNPFTQSYQGFKDCLTDMNIACQKGLVTRFDSSIGAGTVLMPYGGKTQMTPVQASVQALPTLDSTSDTATILSYGFIPKISHYSPFLSAIYAVLESVAKVYAVGGNKDSLYFSFQEYFEKLGHQPEKWGKVTQSLLGSIYAQDEIKVCSIGGKDSMSGTFNDLNVVETLISFACTPVKIDHVITPQLKEIGHKLYLLPLIKDERGFPNLAAMMVQYERLHQYIVDKKVVSAFVLEHDTIASGLFKMALGNQLGFEIHYEHLFDFNPTAILLEADCELDFDYLGTVSDKIVINQQPFSLDVLNDQYQSVFNQLYPVYKNLDKGNCENLNNEGQPSFSYGEKVDQVKVLIPIFPGTNCEYDSAKAFKQVGAQCDFVVIRNKRQNDINESIAEFVEKLDTSHILMFAGGFSSGDEPDGSAKFIVNFLKNDKVKAAVTKHLQQRKLILGICNGFQALIKSGLLPYGEIRDLTQNDLTLYRNDSYSHISTTARCRVASTNSPWLSSFELGEQFEVVFSHGEGKLVGVDLERFKHLAAFQYCDLAGQASMNGEYNPNGSLLAIEGLVSENGLILGKMGHSERYNETLYKTRTLKKPQNIFENGVKYFLG